MAEVCTEQFPNVVRVRKDKAGDHFDPDYELSVTYKKFKNWVTVTDYSLIYVGSEKSVKPCFSGCAFVFPAEIGGKKWVKIHFKGSRAVHPLLRLDPTQVTSGVYFSTIWGRMCRDLHMKNPAFEPFGEIIFQNVISLKSTVSNPTKNLTFVCTESRADPMSKLIIDGSFFFSTDIDRLRFVAYDNVVVGARSFSNLKINTIVIEDVYQVKFDEYCFLNTRIRQVAFSPFSRGKSGTHFLEVREGAFSLTNKGYLSDGASGGVYARMQFGARYAHPNVLKLCHDSFYNRFSSPVDGKHYPPMRFFANRVYLSSPYICSDTEHSSLTAIQCLKEALTEVDDVKVGMRDVFDYSKIYRDSSGVIAIAFNRETVRYAPFDRFLHLYTFWQLYLYLDVPLPRTLTLNSLLADIHKLVTGTEGTYLELQDGYGALSFISLLLFKMIYLIRGKGGFFSTLLQINRLSRDVEQTLRAYKKSEGILFQYLDNSFKS